MQSDVKPLGFTLGPMLSAFARPLKVKIKQAGIPYTFEHLILLKKITTCSELMAQQELAEQLGKDKSVVLRMVDLLENDGLLKRQVDANDRRRNLLMVTESGDKYLHQISELEMELTLKLVQNIPESELETFYAVIEKIKRNAESL